MKCVLWIDINGWIYLIFQFVLIMFCELPWKIYNLIIQLDLKSKKNIQENINILTWIQNFHFVLFPIVTKNIKFFEISTNQLIIECKRWWLNWFHGHVAKQFEELRCSVRRHLSKTSMQLDVTCNPSVECQWFDKPTVSVK